MLGALRFMLAMAVAFSHMGLTPNFHFGAMSVVVFFLIAGYVMTYSFQVNFDNKLSNLRSFYVDRFFRIYPLYLLSLTLIYGFSTFAPYGKLYLDSKSMIVNLTVFGLNARETIMNPAAWSLGTEVQFYLLLPFLVRFRALKYTLLPISYAIFAIASFELINPIEWAYKYLPGTLFFFILGSVIFDMRTDATRTSKWIVRVMLSLAVINLAALSFNNKSMAQPYAFESLSGMLFGTGALIMLGDSKPAHKKLDNFLGKLSYPIFLSHVVVLYFFDYLRIHQIINLTPRGMVALQLLGTLLMSLPFMLVDDYVQAMRKRIQLKNTHHRAGDAGVITTQAPSIEPIDDSKGSAGIS